MYLFPFSDEMAINQGYYTIFSTSCMNVCFGEMDWKMLYFYLF